MENTTQNALDFMVKELNIDSAIAIATIEQDYIKCMVAYASACYAPSSIGDDEKNRIVQEVIEMHPYKVPGKPDTYCDYNQGWEDACDILDQHLTKYAISRLSERKIVLPSKDDMVKAYHENISFTSFATPWNACIESIKRLNGINQ